MRRRLFLAIAAAGGIAAPPMAFAQGAAYPSKPIRLVVPYPPGGPLDVAARTLADRVKDSLGNVIVENKPGAGGNLGVGYVAGDETSTFWGGVRLEFGH